MTYSEVVEKIKAMPEEEKQALAKKLDEWTLKHVEDCQNREFSEDGIDIKYISTSSDYLQMDDVFLYYYLLGLPLYAVKDRNTIYPSYEIQVRAYKANGKPFPILCIANKDEFEEMYADIITKEEPKEETEDEDEE